MFGKKLIFFYYFPFKNVDYTPLDLGYVLAMIKKKGMGKYAIEMRPHPLSFYESERDIKENIGKEVSLILDKKPKAVFFFLDNLNWSAIYAFGRAKRIAREFRKSRPKIFIGAQSYKFHPQHIKNNSIDKIFDCLIFGNPERSLLSFDKIFSRNKTDGVLFNNAQKNEVANCYDHAGNEDSATSEKKDLDHIPSPYLEGIFDKYLTNRQRENKDNFTVFINSSRGCQFGCYYCFRSIKYEQIRFFSVERFCDEIEYIRDNFGITRFFILDDAFVSSKKRLNEFCEEFKRRKFREYSRQVKFFINARPEQLNSEIFSLLKDMDVSWVQVGLQTINPNLQHYMNRRVGLEKFNEISELAGQFGINLYVDVIAGLPFDSVEYFRKTIDFAISLRPKTIQVKQLYHSPDTRFFLEEKKYGIVVENINKDFLLPCVAESAGLDKGYYDKAFSYVIKKSGNTNGIAWKVIMQNGIYLSKKTDFRF